MNIHKNKKVVKSSKKIDSTNKNVAKCKTSSKKATVKATKTAIKAKKPAQKKNKNKTTSAKSTECKCTKGKICDCSKTTSIGSIMADSMRKYASHLSTIMIAVMMTVLTVVGIGCKSVPSVDTVETMARAVGVATGTACNMTKVDDTTRNAIVDIANIVSECVPTTNQTFEAAWYPIAVSHVNELIAENKIDKTQGEIICEVFKTVCKGADYIITVRYPKIREYTDLISAAAHGFIDGFLVVFKPVNIEALSCSNEPMDVIAYKYLIQSK